jgi:hypothetical protein
MKLHQSLFLFPFAASVLLVSCKKNAQDIPSPGVNGNSSVAFKLKATNTSSVVNRTTSVLSTADKTTSVSIQWTAGSASATEIKFEGKKQGSEVEFKSKVNQTVDLFNLSSSLGSISIPSGTYSEVEFKAELSPTSNNPAFELSGQFATGGVTTNVIFRANENIEVKGEKNNVTITDSSLSNAITSLDLSLITKGINQAALTSAVKTNGTILITSSINSDLYKIIVENLRHLEDEEDLH